MKGAQTARQVRSYRDNGYLYPVDVLSEADTQRHYERLVDVEARHGPMHYRVKPYLIVESAYEIATNTVLLDAVESLLGPDILLWDGSYVIKEPRSESFVSWHQDLTYWGLAMESADDLVSAWVALTPATVDNGCMRFVRGSHRNGRYAHCDTHDADNILHRGQSIAEDFDASLVDTVELAPGQASLHHGWVVHSSAANSSDTRRVGLVLNFLKPGVRQVVGNGESATLVRGSDRYGNFAPEPACGGDLVPANVAFQVNAEKRKREVYDTA